MGNVIAVFPLSSMNGLLQKTVCNHTHHGVLERAVRLVLPSFLVLLFIPLQLLASVAFGR